jgi:hypothetical protein
MSGLVCVEFGAGRERQPRQVVDPVHVGRRHPGLVQLAPPERRRLVHVGDHRPQALVLDRHKLLARHRQHRRIADVVVGESQGHCAAVVADEAGAGASSFDGK